VSAKPRLNTADPEQLEAAADSLDPGEAPGLGVEQRMGVAVVAVVPPGENVADWLWISKSGRVWSDRSGRELSSKNPTHVSVRGKNQSRNRLILSSWVGQPEPGQVACGKTHGANCLGDLFWGTHADGSRARSDIDYREAVAVWVLSQRGHTAGWIAHNLGISPSIAKGIICRGAHLDDSDRSGLPARERRRGYYKGAGRL
jgi:hypothetical protein